MWLWDLFVSFSSSIFIQSQCCARKYVCMCVYISVHTSPSQRMGLLFWSVFRVILGLASGHVSQLKEERLFTRIIISVFSASSQRIRPSGFGPSSLPVPAVRRVSVWCVPAFNHVLLIDVGARSPLQNNKISDKLEMSCIEKRSVFVLTFQHFTAQPVSLFYVKSFFFSPAWNFREL